MDIALALTFLLLLAVSVAYMSRREVPSGMALVVRGRGDRLDVHFGQRHLLAPFESAELLDVSTKAVLVKRSGRNSMRCRDGVRVTARATFLVGVNATREDVLRVRRRVSAKTLASADGRAELFSARFERALDVVAAQFDYRELSTRLDVFCDKVCEAIGVDLDGFRLEDMSLTQLSMVAITQLDEDDPVEGPAIRQLTEAAIAEKTRVAELEHELARRVARLEHELVAQLLELERQRQAAVFGIEAEVGVRPNPDKLRARLDERLRELVSLVGEQS